MFNSPFNTTRFNLNAENNDLYGTATMVYSGTAFLSVKKHLKAEAGMEFSGKNTIKSIKYFAFNSEMEFSGEFILKIIKYFAGIGNIEYFSDSTSISLYGSESIFIQGLTFRPGDELRIDTDEMTVKLNGEDVTYMFSAESDFFAIQPGQNIIVYEDNVQARNIEIRYLWRDKWL